MNMNCMLSIYINGKPYHIRGEISILEACRLVGVTIPRFCYHEALTIAGNCRMCLVEVADVAKPVVACSTDITENMLIYTESPLVLKARESILEFLLLNHPLDCPICDQAGECDLQDQAIFFGSNISRNYFRKRGVEDKLYNNLIKTIMVRCIHCTRCVRFGEEICGVKFFGTLNRGTNTEIGNYLLKLSLSEISANVIDLCPVGALTLNSIPYQIRPWEVQFIESVDLSDCLGANIYLVYRGNDIFRVVPKKNKYINDLWISNKCRFYFDLLIKKPFDMELDTLPEILSKHLHATILFLANPDFDLKALYCFKLLSNKSKNYSFKLLNSTRRFTNLMSCIKPTIKTLNQSTKYTFFLISSNLQIELPILNIRIKSQVVKGSNVISLNGSESNFPLYFTRCSIFEILKLFQGSHFLFSKFFFQTTCVFFTNTILKSSIDLQILHLLQKKKVKYFQPSMFCNSESANAINIKVFNYKEFFFRHQIFGLGLDDSFLLRKLLSCFLQFFWVNQFPAGILALIPINSWIAVNYNQSSGIYLNLEQRAQQFTRLNTTFDTSLLIISTIFFSLLQFKKSNKSNLVLNNFNFDKFFYTFSEFKELNSYRYLFDNNKKKIFFFNLFLLNSSYYFYNTNPAKSLFEDPYRTSLHLKYSRSLAKSSQLLRLE